MRSLSPKPEPTHAEPLLAREEGAPAHASRRQIQTEHRYQRDVLRLLELALSTHALPPGGHAFFRYIEEAIAYFEVELPRHVLHEEQSLFPDIARHAPEVARLLASDHESILDTAARFVGEARGLLSDPSQRRWDAVASEARLIESMLKGHLAREEGALRLPLREAY